MLEIGVPKILGADTLSLRALWLEHYAYRTALSWWIFASAGAGILLITLLTVSYQSLKAAFMNPVRSLRSE